MSHNTPLNRRHLLAWLAGAAVGPALPALAESLPSVRVTKDPTCGCCTGWVAHLRQSGFTVEVVESTDLDAVKRRLGVPDALAGCHTGEVAGYVVEGHVPAGALERLLAERPKATGLAVPGMPAGSPGMDFPGTTLATYEVILFGPSGRRTFARYRGGQEL